MFVCRTVYETFSVK